MGIYIKDMMIPTNRGEYVFLLYVDSDGTTTVEGARSIFKGEPFEAIPVQPHGDLIDRDALMKGEGRYIISFGKEGIDVAEINRAPTIIPAEEGE